MGSQAPVDDARSQEESNQWTSGRFTVSIDNRVQRHARLTQSKHTTTGYIGQALDKLARDVIHRCEQLTVLKGKDPEGEASVDAFVQGFITWHLCDHRYRMNEIAERSGDSLVGVKFGHYYEQGRKAGYIDPKEWAVPSVAAMAEQANRSSL